MLIAAVNNILVEPKWLDFKANGLADVFSQFNEMYIANIGPSWQDSFATILYPQSDLTPSQAAILANV